MDCPGQILGPYFGTTFWDHILGSHFGTAFWDHIWTQVAQDERDGQVGVQTPFGGKKKLAKPIWCLNSEVKTT